MRGRSEIGGYRLIKRIGYGGMSTVFKAVDADGNSVALKLLHPAVAADPSSRDRLRREVAMLQRVHGPYVAQIIDAETEEDDIFLVTELIDGPTLETDVADSGVYEGRDLVELGEELRNALNSIHKAGVLHRDLKPSNVMVGPDGLVLIDFGIAQLGDDLRITQQGSLTHTPGYCDPRVIGGADPDADADWWALAAVLAYAASGHPPFGGGSNPAVMNRVLSGQPLFKGLPPELTDFFGRALAADPSDRISYDELLLALDNPSAFRRTSPGSWADDGNDDGDWYDDGTGDDWHDDDVDRADDAERQWQASEWGDHTAVMDAGAMTGLGTARYETDPTVHDAHPGPASPNATRRSSHDGETFRIDQYPPPGTEHMPAAYDPAASVIGGEPLHRDTDGNRDTAGYRDTDEFGGFDPQTQRIPIVDDSVDRTQIMPAPIVEAPSYRRSYAEPVYPERDWRGAADRLDRVEPREYLEARDNFPERMPGWLKPPPSFTLFHAIMLAAFAVVGAVSPLASLLTLALFLLIFGTYGDAREELRDRRMRRGGPYRNDVTRSIFRLPLTLLGAVLKGAIALAIGTLFGFGIGWLVSLGQLLPPTINTIVSTGLAVGIAWTIQLSKNARLGSRYLFASISPTTGYRFFWIAVAILLVMGALMLVSSSSGTDWTPLTNPLW